jgi:Uma2 family endonuclease
VLDVLDHEGRICELIDGTLVEKVMGFGSPWWPGTDHRVEPLPQEAQPRDRRRPRRTLTLTTGCSASPTSRSSRGIGLPGRKRPTQPIPRLAIDIAVEVVSKGNTKAELERKLGEYFDAGTRLVWFLDPRKRTARVYTSPERSTRLTEDQSLDGGDVLPGFTVSLRALFDRAHRGPDD